MILERKKKNKTSKDEEGIISAFLKGQNNEQVKESRINEICGEVLGMKEKKKTFRVRILNVYIKEGKMETRRKNISKMKNEAKEMKVDE